MMSMHSICVKKNDAELKGGGGILSFFSFKIMSKKIKSTFLSENLHFTFFSVKTKTQNGREKKDRVHTYIFGEISDTDTVIISVTQHKHVYIRESS